MERHGLEIARTLAQLRRWIEENEHERPVALFCVIVGEQGEDITIDTFAAGKTDRMQQAILSAWEGLAERGSFVQV